MEGIKILTFFTDPYKDELVYSSIARYHFYSGNINLKDTLEELFRSRTVAASVEIGSRFTILAEQMGRNYSVESLLTSHTIYPYYALFLSVQRQQEVITHVKGKGSGLYGRLGIISGGICKKDGLYYCSFCAADDIEKYGEPYIHREHQLQGIEYCGYHEDRLKKYVSEQRTESQFEYIRFDKKIMDLSVSHKVEHDEFSIVQIKLAKMAYQLLQVPINKFSRELIDLKYRALFRERNLITLENKVRKKELYRAFSTKFPKGFLEKYESSLKLNETHNWLNLITYNIDINVHPFRHLLLIFFLDQDIDSFLEIEPDQGPFGSGPWPCLNKVAKHFEQNVVNKLVIKKNYRAKQPVGEFSCSCGFIYQRKGPDKTTNDKYRISYIKEYGETWRAEIQKLHKSGLSINEVAKQLEVSRNKISRQLRYSEKSKDDTYSVCKEELIAKYRKELLKVMKQFPNYSRTELIRQFNKVYKYLGKNDREWFYSNIPQKQKAAIPRTRIDWSMRDQDYYEKIKVLYEELLELDTPVKITRRAIGRRLNILANIMNRELAIKLPRTNQLLNEITESVQDFQIRRCIKIIDKLLEDSEQFGIWKVQKKGGVRSHHWNEIKPNLEEYLKDKK